MIDFDKCDREVLQALTTAFGNSEHESIEVIGGGLSASSLFLVHTQNKKFVVRIINKSLPVDEREREISCAQAFADKGIAPKIYYADANDSVIVMDYIEKHSLSPAICGSNEFLVSITKLLRGMHCSEIKLPQMRTVFHYVDETARTIISQLSLPKFVVKTISRIKEIGEVLQGSMMHVPCHNDINPNNLLFDGEKLWLIDWAAAGMGDPYLDLATVANYFIHDEAKIDKFLNYYFIEKPTDQQKARFYVMRPVSLCFYGITLLDIVRQVNPKLFGNIQEDNLPGLNAFYADLAIGKEQLESLESQIKLGFIMFNEASRIMAEQKYKNFLTVLDAQ